MREGDQQEARESERNSSIAPTAAKNAQVGEGDEARRETAVVVAAEAVLRDRTNLRANNGTNYDYCRRCEFPIIDGWCMRAPERVSTADPAIDCTMNALRAALRAMKGEG